MPAELGIVTVTLNPAIDRVVVAEQFKIGAHQQARRLGWYPAGKGINVSRVLATLGTRSVATGFVGAHDLALFEEFLERRGRGRVVMQLLIVPGRTRENITIMDPVLDTETHIRDEGFRAPRDAVRRATSKIEMLARPGRVVVFAGSLPPGVSPGDLRSMLHVCQDEGARIVVDTSGANLAAVRDERVWMLKLNHHELAELTGMPTDDEAAVFAAARAVCLPRVSTDHDHRPAAETDTGGGPAGGAEYVVVTRGGAGAVLVSRDVELTARVFVHPGRIANTVGSGDSLLAGILHAWSRGQGWRAAMTSGVAVATANAVSREPGTLSLDDVEEFTAAAMIEERTPEPA